MKRLLFISFLLLLTNPVFAQDYSVVIPFQAQFFAAKDQSFIQYLSWSPVKVMYFNTLNVSGQDTDFYTFHTWRDTVNQIEPNCIEIEGPAWTGDHIHKSFDGNTLFFNYEGDTILLKPNSSINDTWKFMKWNNSGYVNARLDSIIYARISGIQDSIKCFSLHVYDSTGMEINSHSLNNETLLLSKSNGLLSTFDFYYLPDFVYPMHRIDSIPMSTQAQIFDYDVGDEFEYYSQCSYLWGGDLPPVFFYFKILSKFFSPGMDTVFYHRRTVTLSFDIYHIPPDSVKTISEDTIHYPLINSPFLRTFPEENLFNSDSSNLLNYTLRKDTGLYHGRQEYMQITGYLGGMPFDSCIEYNHFEPVFYTTCWAPGLGETFIESNEGSMAGPRCYRQLMWYHKSNEFYGYYRDLTVGLEKITSPPDFLIYPNPVKSSFQIKLMNENKMTLKLSDLSGRILLEMFIQESVSFDMENFSSGIYFISLSGKSGNFVKKIIKE